jgi:3-methyladenine DNA glycosylase/8-oxoguanine DNA glycosylase
VTTTRTKRPAARALTAALPPPPDDHEPHGPALRHLASADPRLAPWIARAGAPTLPPRSRPPADQLFEGLVEAVVSQQLSGKAAATIAGRVRALGAAGRLPAPHALAAIDDAHLRAAGLSGAKIASVKDLAARVASGSLRLDELGDLDDEVVVERLVEVRGIGRWTAQMALMFRLGRPDVLPVADLGVRKGAMRLTRGRELPDAARLERIARPWRPYRSVACWYLWRIAETKEPA